MIAERSELTSLRRAPDGRVWQPGATGRENLAVYNSRSRGGPVPWEDSGNGPRNDAGFTKYLPTLTPGVDKLPRRCIFCRSAMLNKQEPVGGEQRGLLSCTGCGRPLAWLRPRLRDSSRPLVESMTFRPLSQPAQPPARTVEPMARRNSLPSVGLVFERVDGCGPACGFRTGHDPKAHEDHGRKLAYAEMMDRPTGVVRTGLLAIDLDTERVTVGGRPAVISLTEWKILTYVARRLDRVCPYFDVIESVWDRATAELASRSRGGSAKVGAYHVLNIHRCRLRAKLGPAAALVETVIGRGLRLRAEPPIGAEP